MEKFKEIAQAHLLRRANEHQKSIALMKFLSAVSLRLGVSKHVYVVGGAVRNWVIKKPIKDIDVVIDSVALQGKDSAWFAGEVAKSIPARTSLQTNQYGVAILTVQGDWWVDGVNLGGEVIEVANARKESYGGEGGKGYKPHAVEPATIEEDVVRRELTFNTLLWRMHDLASGPDKAEIVDITGCGVRDLEEGTMRCPSDPDKTFADDPTRMLRVIRFLIKYGFKIDPPVAAAIRRNAPKLRNSPPNAISTILVNDILSMQQSPTILKAMQNLGLLDVIKDMVVEDKSFRQTLLNWAKRDANVLFLFDMMDIGLPLGARIDFLDATQKQRLRDIALTLSHVEAGEFVDVLKQPGRVLDTEGIMVSLDIPPAQAAVIMGAARQALLNNPTLIHMPDRLTREVLEVLR